MSDMMYTSRRSRKRKPKHALGDIVYYATTEMLAEKIAPVKMQVVQVDDFDPRTNCFHYRAIPIEKHFLSMTEIQVLHTGGAAGGNAMVRFLDPEERTEGRTPVQVPFTHAKRYRQWELLTYEELRDKRRATDREMERKAREKLERMKAQAAGGLQYAVYRYKRSRQHGRNKDVP